MSSAVLQVILDSRKYQAELAKLPGYTEKSAAAAGLKLREEPASVEGGRGRSPSHFVTGPHAWPPSSSFHTMGEIPSEASAAVSWSLWASGVE